MADPDLTRIGETLAKATDARSLRAVLASLAGIDWESFPQARLQLSRMLIRKGLARDGLDLLPAAQEPLQAEVEQLRAYGLANTGAPLTAARHLQELLAQGHEDSETLGLLGRTEKDLARRAEQRDQAMGHWRNALQYYRRAFDLTGDSYPGINAAALSLRIGAIEQAQSLARKVLLVCDAKLRDAPKGDDWTLSTKAEALLILGETESAQQFYREAAERLSNDWSALGSTVQQARELLSDLGLASDLLDGVFALPTVAVFSGHRIDTAERTEPRFPASAEAQVRQRIEVALAEANVGIGYGAAANGADLIFFEVLLAMGGDVHLVLPMEIDVFRQFSVAHEREPQWLRRYDQVVEQATSVTIVSEQVDLDDASVLDYGNRVALGLASLKGSEIGTDLIGIALWDGQPGMPGGTADCVQLWRQQRLPTRILSVDSKPPVARKEAAPAAESEASSKRVLMSMLFADIVGYSRLSEQDIERFYSHVLPEVAALSSAPRHKPVVTQSFGDAFYFVFESAQQTADFALALNALFRKQLGAFDDLELRIRIALHSGPLLRCFDPLRNAVNYTGRHTSRAARVEPVAPENQILATQQFAAMLALEARDRYDLAYAGERVLPKGYGIERLFVLSTAASSLL